MRTFKLAGLALLAALAMGATGVNMDTASKGEILNCASGGSSAVTLPSTGVYLFRVMEADTYVCFAASGSTCASGGELFPVGTVMNQAISGDKLSVSCRSLSSTGDVALTKVN